MVKVIVKTMVKVMGEKENGSLKAGCPPCIASRGVEIVSS